ncbi:hypothetical protein [Chryseosolibacter indicus]|uniref:Tetratricopeptide repeat protein n=1 Tax=Chryseosolibacter indicus TaxID=2782351 RepID=A0ABS5VS29_9BACT|nr:hypothetical protein [Chryseosolibacter indicus]MBT1703838.1 hypothetical protein [Chryseosolibacter indicus]
MQSVFFWRSWSSEYRMLWYILSGLFIISLIFLWAFYFNDGNGVIAWERIQEQKTIETTVHSFKVGPFTLAVPGESYVIFEYFGGGDVVHNQLASYVFLAVVIISSLFLLTLITTLERFWFLAGMSLFIIFVASLRLDVLLLFGLSGSVVPATVIVIYTAIGYYFKNIKASALFSFRLIVFAVLTLIVGIIIALFSQVPYPILHLAVTAYTPALILSILFIITVAHEIPASFVYITDQGGTNNVKHFSVISFIYIINVLITCFHEMGVINWNFLYINLYLLITLSAILGIWGFMLREPQYENIFSFHPSGAFFIISLGSICFITCAQLLGNMNDATLKVVRDFIIFCHAGFGIIFFTYFLSNFLPVMASGIQIKRILYKPHRMPYFTFRFAGLIASLAFLFYSNWREYVYHSVAGFYNYVADLYTLQENESFARSFYEQSSSRAFANNRANYVLGKLKSTRLDIEGAYRNYELANTRRPTEFSLVNEANLHFWTKAYFDGIRSLKSASTKMPGSARIENNLGYAYAKVHSLDSASYYLNRARENDQVKSSAETNFLAMAAAEYIPINTDSVVRIFNSTSASTLSNLLAVATLFGQALKIEERPNTKVLDLYSATFLNNYITRNAKSLDTAFIEEAFKIASDSVNYAYSEALKASLANAYYHEGNLAKALDILGGLTYSTQSYKGKYNYIMGLWALEQGNPQVASSYFSQAETADYKHARFYNAIALTEARRINEALIAWDSVATTEEQSVRSTATQVRRILTLSATEALTLEDGDKYQYSRYRVALKDTLFLKRLISTFDNNNYKAQALLDAAQRFYNADLLPEAISFLTQTRGIQLTDKRLFNDIRYLELRMLASKGDLRTLARQINKGVEFDKEHELQKMLYTALLAESNGDTTQAGKIYNVLGRFNPFFEEGVLAASNFFKKQDPKSQQTYNLLVDAIYRNPNSIKLLKAYAREAARQGFDEYAVSAAQRLNELESALR